MALSQRQREIEQLLLTEKRVEVADLVRRLGASEVAVRKDLAEFETRGFCLRTASGAILAERPEAVVPYVRRARQYVAAKEAIAAAAARLIEDGDFILLDAGSTTLELARALRQRELHVLTNSLPAADILAESDSVQLTLIGGTFRRATLSMVGPVAMASLRLLHVSKAFLGAAGFDEKTGFGSSNLIEAQTKSAMIAAADKVYVLADSTKFEQASFTPFATLAEVDAVITNQPPPPAVARLLGQFQVQLVLASEQDTLRG